MAVRRVGLAVPQRLDELLTVDGEAERLTDALVLQLRVIGVEHDEVRVLQHDRLRVQVLVAFDDRDLVRRNLDDHVELAADKAGDARRDLRHLLERHRLRGGPAHEVAVIGDEADIVVALPVLEGVGAGADGRPGLFPDGDVHPALRRVLGLAARLRLEGFLSLRLVGVVFLLADDPGRVGGKPVLQDQVRLLRHEPDLVRAELLDPVDVAEIAAGGRDRRVLSPHSFFGKGEEHVVGSKFFAVVELHALAQLQLERRRADPLPGCREAGNEVRSAAGPGIQEIAADERVEDRVGGPDVDVPVVGRWLQAARQLIDGDHQVRPVVRGGRRRGGPGDRHGQCGCQRDEENAFWEHLGHSHLSPSVVVVTFRNGARARRASRAASRIVPDRGAKFPG